MKFVRINEYHVNLDHVVYIIEDNTSLGVAFKKPDGDAVCLNVQKDSPEGKNLIRAIIGIGL